MILIKSYKCNEGQKEGCYFLIFEIYFIVNFQIRKNITTKYPDIMRDIAVNYNDYKKVIKIKKYLLKSIDI